jgi:hypothetical protein
MNVKIFYSNFEKILLQLFKFYFNSFLISYDLVIILIILLLIIMILQF